MLTNAHRLFDKKFKVQIYFELRIQHIKILKSNYFNIKFINYFFFESLTNARHLLVRPAN